MNDKKLIHKRVLITDFNLRDHKLYQDLMLVLSMDGATIFALLNVKTIQSTEFLKKFPRVIPIVMNTCRVYEEIDGVDVDLSKVNFEGGPERKLIESLPKFDHVVNFAGPKFVETFTLKRAYYHVENLEYQNIRPRLKNSTLISTKFPYTIVHIVPNVSLRENLRASFGISNKNFENEKEKHYVKSTEPVIEFNESQVEDLPFISRSNVLRKSLTLRIRKYVDERIFKEPIPSFNQARDTLIQNETEKIRIKLKEAYAKSVTKLENRKRKLLASQEKKEQKLNKEIGVLKDRLHTNTAEFLSEDTRQARLADETVDIIHEARKRVAERQALRSVGREYNIQSRALEKTFQFELENLYETWYKELLLKQGKILRKITKKNAEKIKAAERVLL